MRNKKKKTWASIMYHIEIIQYKYEWFICISNSNETLLENYNLKT